MAYNRWWQHRIIYQIYPRSFCDSNNDGIGDIPGIISKLDYLQELGIGAIWLSPVYKSPNSDNGYDIADYRDINPEYGTLLDMKNLLREAEARDIKIVMDLVINHTSDEHQWFTQSIDPSSPYHDYYIWRPGRIVAGKELPPNNWQSQFTGSAWTKHPDNGLWYLRLFTPKQPDLNYHNWKVVEEVKALMKFWLDLGVAGFRCDVINMIYKTSLEDGKARIYGVGEEHYLSQPGSHHILKQFHDEVWAPYGAYTVGETVRLSRQEAIDYTDGELENIFQFDHTNIDQWLIPVFKVRYQPEKMRRTLGKWQTDLPWNTVFFENHDIPRSVSRFGDDKRFHVQSATMLALVLMTLRGTPFIFQGQEIGTTNHPFSSIDDVNDIVSRNVYKMLRRLLIPNRLALKIVNDFTRDHARRPMAWTADANGGFSSSAPWLKPHPDYEVSNIASAKAEPASIWHFYKRMIAIRNKDATLQTGTIEMRKDAREVLSFTRTTKGETLHILANLGKRARRLPTIVKGHLVISNTKMSEEVAISVLEPYQALIIKL